MAIHDPCAAAAEGTAADTAGNPSYPAATAGLFYALWQSLTQGGVATNRGIQNLRSPGKTPTRAGVYCLL